MKKIIASLMLIGVAALPATAANKYKTQKVARTNIDHSHDQAYSAAWADRAVSPAPSANFSLGGPYATGPYMKGRTFYYGLNNFTLYGATAVSMNAPYEGDYAPSWDGPAKNAYRNMRANNESEPLPPNNGYGHR